MQELSDEKSWTYGRMPEYIWIGLICEAAVCELLAGAVHAESGWQAREL